jgi:hypothetical protein
MVSKSEGKEGRGKMVLNGMKTHLIPSLNNLCKYLRQYSKKTNLENECIFRILTIILEVYSGARADFSIPNDLKWVFEELKSIFIEFGKAGNKTDLKLDGVWSPVVNGISGGDIGNLLLHLINVCERKENMSVSIEYNLPQVLLEWILVGSKYQVYINSPYIQSNCIVYLQNVCSSTNQKDTNKLLKENNFFEWITHVLKNLISLKDFKLANSVCKSISFLMDNSDEAVTKYFLNEKSIFSTIVKLRVAADVELRNFHQVFFGKFFLINFPVFKKKKI